MRKYTDICSICPRYLGSGNRYIIKVDKYHLKTNTRANIKKIEICSSCYRHLVRQARKRDRKE